MIPGLMLVGQRRGAASAGSSSLNVSDLFDVSLYTGDGTSSKLVPGIDLSGGGASLLRSRSAAQNPVFHYSPNGASPQEVICNSSNGGAAAASTFGSGGTTLTASTHNVNTRTYLNWSLKKASRFCDVVTYTGNGTNQNIAHSLGVEPGMILIKRLDTTANWTVYCRDLGNGAAFFLNLTGGSSASASHWNSTSPTSAVFTVGNGNPVNASGGSYVAILLAHDTASDSVCKAFTYTGNSGAVGPTVSLGWQPQAIILIADSTRHVFDTTRTSGFTGNDASSVLNNSTAESTSTDLIQLTASGFEAVGTGSVTNTNGRVYYGIAIRAP